MLKQRYSIITNSLLIAFPLFYAVTVCYSFTLENSTEPSRSEIKTHNECCDSMFINIGIAILLAAIFNAKKIIKVGAL